MSYIKYSDGFSLIELLATMVMSILMLSVLTDLIVQVKKNQNHLHQLTILQDDGRFASHVIRHEIASAGNLNCGKKIEQDNAVFIRVYANGIVPVDFKIRSIPYSDVIWVQSIEPHISQIISPVNDPEKIRVTSNQKIKKNSKIYISDCQNFEFAQVSSVKNNASKSYQVLTLSKPLNHLFKSAEIGLSKKMIFFVSQTSRKNKKGELINGLYLKEMGKQKTELVDQVESIHVKSYVRNHAQIILKNASAINDWSKVVGLKINLLFSHHSQYFFMGFLKEKIR